MQPKMEAYNRSSVDSKTRWPSLGGDFKSRRRHNLRELGREATRSGLAQAIAHNTTAQPWRHVVDPHRHTSAKGGKPPCLHVGTNGQDAKTTLRVLA